MDVLLKDFTLHNCQQVNMTYIDGGTNKKTINTPERRKAIISMTIENFKAAARHVASFRKAKYHTMAAIVQQILSEMKDICS